MGSKSAKAGRRGSGRLVRTLRSLAAITALGVTLAVYNAVSLHRDANLAVGPAGPDQERFFKDAADRPDIAIFFKGLTPSARLSMSKNIGRYTDPELAKLCGKCLDTFDPAAREALTDSLARISSVHPEATAALLTLPGSFQQLAIAAALRRAGPIALPLVAKEFAEADARPNAVAYLVSVGPSAVQATLPFLNSKDKDIRLAAADTLGKLHAREAVEPLTKLFAASPEEERLSYLTALAGIGDPASEGLMADTLRNGSLPTPHRAQAALGLGAIQTNSSLNLLWTFSTDVDKSLREAAIAGLRLAGDNALIFGSKMPAGIASAKSNSSRDVALLTVAGGIHSALADQIIQNGLMNPARGTVAAAVAGGRPSLVPILVGHIQALNASTQGDVIDSIMIALASTPQGTEQLKAMRDSHPGSPIGALASRRLSLSGK